MAHATRSLDKTRYDFLPVKRQVLDVSGTSAGFTAAFDDPNFGIGVS